MEIHEFIKNNNYAYDKINDKHKILEYYDFERNIIDLINNNSYSLILKSRQMYVSTLLGVYSLYSMINNKKIYYFSHNLNVSRMFLERFRAMAINYDSNIFVVDNKDEKRFKKGGSIKLLSSDRTSLHSIDFNDDVIVIIDEADFVKNLNRLMDEIFRRVDANDCKIKIILASTPQAYKLDYFFNLYSQSIRGETEFKSIKINYKDSPNYDEIWAEQMKKMLNGDEDMYKTEILAEFISPWPKIKKPKKNLIQFRLNDDLLNKLSKKLIERDVNVSTYLRDLIIKDVNK